MTEENRMSEHTTKEALNWLRQADEDGVLPRPPSIEVENACLDDGLVLWRSTYSSYRLTKRGEFALAK